MVHVVEKDEDFPVEVEKIVALDQFLACAVSAQVCKQFRLSQGQAQVFLLFVADFLGVLQRKQFLVPDAHRLVDVAERAHTDQPVDLILQKRVLPAHPNRGIDLFHELALRSQHHSLALFRQ